MSRIVQEVYYWLPAHLTTVLFVVLKNQIVTFHSARNPMLIKTYAAFFQCKSLYIITACRVVKKILLKFKFLPEMDTTSYTIYVSIIIHSTAVVTSVAMIFLLWTSLIFHGNIISNIASRMPVVSSSLMLQLFSNLPLTLGALSTSIAFGTCSGNALAFYAIVYFILLSNAYKDYMKNCVCEKPELTADNHCETSSGKTPKDILFKGLQCFGFHTTLLLLLVLMLLLHVGVSIAWFKSVYFLKGGEKLQDPFLLPTISVIWSVSILLQLNAPHKYSGNRIVAIVLYFCACLSIIYCQQKIYRLNYLIAFVFTIIALMELIQTLLHYMRRER